MAEENGQEAGSQTAVAETGQETQVATPTADDIIKAAQNAEASAASETETKVELETKTETETEEKPLPYDQDPKWLAARAAEKNLNEILADHNIDDVGELKNLLSTGMTLKEILGDRDAEQIKLDLTHATTHRRNLAHWEEQKRIKEEENLDPDERADLYKKKLLDKETEEANKKLEAGKVDEAKTMIDGYNTRIGKILEGQGFDDNTTMMAELVLGVNNPFNDVDITDVKAVRAMADSGVQKLHAFIATIKQSAIDDYAAGKSEFTPISPSETPDKTTVETAVTTAPEGETNAEAFARVANEVLEIAAGGAGV